MAFTRRRIDPDDELCIDYYPNGRPAPVPAAAVLARLRSDLAMVDALVASGQTHVAGGSVPAAPYAAGLRKTIADLEAKAGRA